MAATGKSKKRKDGQPKRKRYNNEQRGIKRKEAQFVRHCNEHPNDKQAQAIKKGDNGR